MRRGGFATVEMVFDGKALSVLNRDAKVYGQSDLPGTVDQLVDMLRDDYHRPLPAADLLGQGCRRGSLEFSTWGRGSIESAFTFDPPTGATKVAVADVPDLDEVAGIFVVEGGN